MVSLDFWIEKLFLKDRYPLFFALLSIALYLTCLLISYLLNDLTVYLSNPGWILMNIFGYITIVLTLFIIKNFNKSLAYVRKYTVLDDEKWKDFRARIKKEIFRKTYLIIFAFWMIYSFCHVFVYNLDGWWEVYSKYNSPFIFDVLGYLIQGLNGCLFGGIYMAFIPINLNLAYRKMYKCDIFKPEIASSKGIKNLSKFKKLILIETFSAALMSALAITIWSKITLYAPIIGSLIMFIPTAVIPHYTFFRILSRAKDSRLDLIDSKIKEIPDKDAASISDLILLNKLIRIEKRIKDIKPWLVDIKSIFQLIGTTILSQVLVMIIDMMK